MDRLRRIGMWPALGIPFGSLLAFAVLFAGGPQPDLGVGGQSEPRIVYLPDPARPIVNPREARARGLRVASSVTDLKSAAPAADAFIVDRDQLDGVAARDWLKAQRTRGRIIVALNTSMAVLQRAAGSPFPEPGSFRLDWHARPFYSYVFESPPGRVPGYQGRGSAALHSLDIVLHIVQLGHQQITGTFSPPGSPSPGPRP